MKSKYVKKHECVIIGGGAAGMMAAVQLAGYGIDNCIIEHTGKIGSKILQTGNGKCNFTNLNMSSEMYQNKDNRLVIFLIVQVHQSVLCSHSHLGQHILELSSSHRRVFRHLVQRPGWELILKQFHFVYIQ